MSLAKYDVRLLRVAEDDFTEIILYVAADRPKAAEKLADRIEQKLGLLALNPYLGAAPSDNTLARLGYRFLVQDNYLIFYVQQGEVIYIHRILHGARDYTQLL